MALSDTITSLGTSIINLVGTRAKKDMSNLTTAGEAVIRSLAGGSSRNIGEIVASTVPLVDAGLHPLDGAVIDRAGVYSDFVDYMSDLYTGVTYEDVPFVQPVLTSKGLMGGDTFAVETSSNYSTAYVDYYVFDGNNSTYWAASGNTNPCWLTFYNPEPLKVTYFTMRHATTEQFTAGTIYGSNDNETWAQITQFTNSTTAANVDWFIDLSSNTNYYKYYRILGTSFNGTNNGFSNITITATYKVPSGLFTTEADWLKSVSKTGVCDKFVYTAASGATSAKVRLPKFGNQTWTGEGTAPAKGNGITLGLTDGTGTGGLSNYYQSYVSSMAIPVDYGKPIGSSSTFPGFMTHGKTLGVTTDPNKSGIIADLSKLSSALNTYYYIVLATVSKTDIQVDLDEVTTEINNMVRKSDLSEIQCIVETYQDGYSWYRIWSDGWCEQGGYNATGVGGTYSVVLLKPYQSMVYNISVNNTRYPNGTTINSHCISAVTAEGFSYYDSYSYGSYWRTAGYMRV